MNEYRAMRLAAGARKRETGRFGEKEEMTQAKWAKALHCGLRTVRSWELEEAVPRPVYVRGMKRLSGTQ